METNQKVPGRWNPLKAAFGIYGAVTIGLLGFIGGIAVTGMSSRTSAQEGTGAITNKSAPPKYASKDVDMNQFWNVYSAIKGEYLRQPALDPELFYGSIKGMVAALGDPYSVYFDPDEAAQFRTQLTGSFDGIGAEIGFKGGEQQLIVTAPLPGTPAWKAGLKPGDAILKINGEDAAGMAIDIAISKIRGPKGTTAVLNIYRSGIKDPFDVSIVRDTITVDSVKWRMLDGKGKETQSNGGVAVITVSEFGQDTVKEFDAALSAAQLRGAKAVIIDLRDDPGGYLDAAVELPRNWIGSNPVVIQRKSDGTETKMSPTLKISPIDLPTAVLVNKWSASASEIVTGAFQDYGKATVVGETTFGKGSVQEYVDDFPDGSALKLTTAEWLTPKGRSIDKKGLTPDVAVPLSEEDAKASRDPQLEKALSIVTGQIDAKAKP